MVTTENKIEKPNIKLLKEFEASHYESGKVVQVLPVDDAFLVSDSDLERISYLCNQKEIYNFLFSERLGGKKYTIESAKGFIDFAKQGWREDKHFVFFVKNSLGEIIGAIDIKSDDIEDAEIGYWMDKNSPGYMTNVVIGLSEVAKKAGFKSLVGYTREANEASKNVLIRAGFKYVGKDNNKLEGVIYDKFRIDI